jgi:hypothetical protein
MIPHPNKLPIIIISSPRTGSNALVEYYERTYKLAYFSEPDSNKAVIESELTDENWTPGELSIENFLEFIKTSDMYVVKIQSSNLFAYYPESYVKEMIAQRAFKIKLQRRNFEEQVASLYLAWNRKIFKYSHQDDHLDGKEYSSEIEIDHDEIDKYIDMLKIYNIDDFKRLEEMGMKFDAEVYYEDLGLIEAHSSIITPRPSNYDELLNEIKKKIK